MSDNDIDTVPSGIVEDRKQRYREQHQFKPILDLIHALNDLYQLKEDEEEQLKEINAEFDVLRLELIPAAMESQGIENMRVEGIGRINLTGDLYVRIADQSKLYDWLVQENLGDLIKETIAPSTLKAFVKNRIKAGKPLPEGTLKITPYSRASITKA